MEEAMKTVEIVVRIKLDPAMYPPEEVEGMTDDEVIETFQEDPYDDLYGARATWTVERKDEKR